VLAVCAYAVIAEPRPPILRATVMALLFCGSLLLGRSRARLNWISAAAVVLLVCDPTAVFDVGFQLSFVAVVGVSYVTPALLRAAAAVRMVAEGTMHGRPFAPINPKIAADAVPRMYMLRRLRHAVWWFAASLFAVSVGAWLAGVPIVATHFNRVQPWGPVSSVVVFPLMYFVMVLGFVKIALMGISPTLGGVVAALLSAVDGLLIRVVEIFASLPGASPAIPAPPWWLVLFHYMFLLSLVWRFRSRPYEPQQDSRPLDRSAPALR
ncbi:unnamed protein product, partial [marine sediment metagenome]